MVPASGLLPSLLSCGSKTPASPSAQSQRPSSRLHSMPHRVVQELTLALRTETKGTWSRPPRETEKALLQPGAPRGLDHWTSVPAFIITGELDNMVPPGQPHLNALWSQDSEVQVSGSVTTHHPLHTLESMKQRKPHSVTCPCLGPAPQSAARASLSTTPLSKSPDLPEA